MSVENGGLFVELRQAAPRECFVVFIMKIGTAERVVMNGGTITGERVITFNPIATPYPIDTGDHLALPLGNDAGLPLFGCNGGCVVYVALINATSFAPPFTLYLYAHSPIARIQILMNADGLPLFNIVNHYFAPRITRVIAMVAMVARIAASPVIAMVSANIVIPFIMATLP